MATTIIHKKSSVASSIPAAGDLEPGEIAVNLADKKLYSKTTAGAVIELAPNSDQLALTENCKNVSGGTLAIGTPVYQSGTAGNAMEVQKALSGTAASMPAVGLLSSALVDEGTGTIVLSGFLQGLNTSTFSEGDTLYVSATGTLTTTVPAGEANFIQNIGKVIKVHSSNGSVMVTGAGRANATPNLDNGNIFIGNASNQAVTANFNDTVDAHLNYSTATSGQVLSYNGSDYDWASVGGGMSFSVKTSNYTLSADEGVIADTSGGAFTITLPASPSVGDTVVVADGDNWNTTNLIVGRNGSTIEGDAANMDMDIGGASVQFTYDGSTWQLYTTVGVDADGYATAAQGALADTALQPTGNGSGLTSLTSANLTGALPAIDGSALTSLTSANLTGALPAIDGSALTDITSANLTGALPAISGSSLTSLTSANLTGALPAIDGSALTGITTSHSVAVYVDAAGGATVNSTSDVTVPASTTEIEDATNYSNTSGVVTVTNAGTYVIKGNVGVNGTTGNYRWTGELSIVKNGSTVIGKVQGGYIRANSGSTKTYVNIDKMVVLAAGDTVELKCKRISTTSGNATFVADMSTLQLQKL